MNKDQIEGAVKSAAGTVQKKVGKVIGSEEQQVKGAIKIAKGKTQKVLGDAKELADDLTSKRKR